MVYFGTLICPFSTKSLLHLHGFLLTRLFFQSLKKQGKQRTACMQFRETTKKGNWIFLNFCGLFRKPELYTNNSPKGMQFGETNEEGSWTCPNREVYLAFNFGSRKY